MQEEFNKLPWSVREANEDSDFVDEAYLKAHSSTYRILHGTLQRVFSSDTESEDGKTPVKASGQFAGTIENRKLNKFYIPCYFDENKIRYPKQSALNKEKQALYLQLMIKYGNKHSLTDSELKQYELLHDKVATERYEFIQFVKQRCSLSQDRYLLLSPDIKKFVEELWHHRRAQSTNYPRSYEPLCMLPLVYSDTRRPIVMKMEKTLLELGSVPYVIWPKFNKRVSVPTDSRMMTKYPPDGRDPRNPNVKLHKEQVSEDKNAEKLAVSNKADIVISANALKTIADNHGPSFERNWDIPIIVRECTDPGTAASRKIVFVDKPLAPRTLSTAEKNLWYYKIGVKPLICHKTHSKILKLTGIQQCEQEGVSDGSEWETEENGSEAGSPVNSLKRKHEAVQSEESEVTDSDGKLTIDCSDSDRSPAQSRITRSRAKLMSVSESQGHKSQLEHSLENLDIKENGTRITHKEKKMETNLEWTLPPIGSNVAYRLWKLHKDKLSSSDMKGNFLKGDNTNREITLLVRCKVDGYENSGGTVYLVPKLEYQTEFGAECVTKSEITQQWMSLFVRPETALYRVRVNVCTSEVIMIEKRSLQDVAHESVQHNNCPVSTVLGTVYNILLGLVDLDTGSYLLSHTPRLGAFVNLRSSDASGRYNLHETYKVIPSAESANEKFLWNPIDYTIVTPYHQAMNRVPGTFPPVFYVRGKPFKKKKKKKKKKGQQQKEKAKQ